MSKPPEEYLRHILQEADYLVSESGGLNLGDFLKDEIRMRAFARSLEIIGEAAKMVPVDFRLSHPEIVAELKTALKNVLAALSVNIFPLFASFHSPGRG